MMTSTPQSTHKPDLNYIGKLLPELFAVFEEPGFNAIYVNPAGMRLLDPEKKTPPEAVILTQIIGVKEQDRFKQEIYPQTKVLGSWAGTMILCDMTGSELACEVKFLDVPAAEHPGGHLLYLYATKPKDPSSSPNGVSDPEILHALLETTPDCVYFKDTASRFLRISRVQAARFGLDHPREAIGKTDFDFFTSEHAAPAFEDEQRIIRTGKPLIDFEEKETYEDGRIAWMSTNKLPFNNREGKLIGTYGVSRDITARKTAEDEIRKRESILRSTFTAAPVGIALVQGRIIRKANDLLCEISGYSSEELLSLPSRILYADQAEYGRVGQMLFDRLGENSRASIETVWRRKNGSCVHLLLSAATLESDGATDWRIVTILDITERKRAEQKLLKLSLAVEQCPVSVIITDAHGDIEYVNPYFEKSSGYTLDEMLGKNPKILKSGQHPEEFYAGMWEQLKSGHPWSGEFCNRKKNGDLFWERAAISGVRDEYGQITHYVAVKEDITAQKQTDRERQEMQARLQLTSKMESVGSLAAGVAHEINTPTQFISDNVRFLTDAFSHIAAVISSHHNLVVQASADSNYAKALATIAAAESEHEFDYFVGEIPRCLEQSRDGLKRIGKIVGSLKEFSHPGGEAKSHADLNRSIETTVAVSHHEWKYVAEVVVELDPSLPPVLCVIDEINQAVLNLVVNAAHAVEDANKQRGTARGRITIRTRRDANNAVIEVEDTGTGIPENVRDRIFEPFFTTKGVGKGTGQGLAIVHTIVVKKHNGRIDFTTEVGKGTTFRLSLPILQLAADAAK